jgi:hypothetical protein
MGLFLCPLMHSTSLWAVSEEEKKWSINFNNTSMSEALDALTTTTGINIIANQIPSNNNVSKRYENKTVEEIVKDLFKGQNIGLVWRYGDSRIDSLDIWILEGNSAKSGNFSRIERPVLRAPPLRRKNTLPRFVKKDTEEEVEEPEADGDENASESSDSEEESEKEDANSDDDSEKEADTDKENEPAEEQEEETEVEPPVSVKE